MSTVAGGIFIPLIFAAFIYLAIIIPVESFKRSLATVSFKRKMFGLSLLLSYALLFLVYAATKIGSG